MSEPATSTAVSQSSAGQPTEASANQQAEPTFIPPTDIIETEQAIRMLLDMPGADPGTLDVTLERRVLTVSAHSISTAPQGYSLLYAEFRDGNYERRFVLSDEIDGDRIEAVLKDGVLRMTLPKASPSPAKKIPVKSD